MSTLHRSAPRILWDGARPSAVIYYLAGISKENRVSKLPTRQPLPHLTHLDVFSYQKEAIKILRDDCLLHTYINHLRFTKKALKKCRRCHSHPTSPLTFHSLLSHIRETWKTIFLPIVMASEEQAYCYQIQRHKPQMASLPKRTSCKVFCELPM